MQAVWKRKWAPVIRSPIFVSGGCGPDVDGTEHVVGEDGESHLGSGSLEVPGQEASAPCHPLDGGERVLDGASSSSHEFWIGSRIGKLSDDLYSTVAYAAAACS